MYLLILLLSAFPGASAADPEIHPICRDKLSIPIPVSEQPEESQIPKLKGCDSEAEYFGIDRPVNDVKARHCAYAEIKNAEGNVFGGESILMMIYANGRGTKRNIPLAMKFACQMESADAELEGRIAHLEDLAKGRAKSKGNLHVCDDVTSGFMGGHCAGHFDRIESVKRKSRLSAILARWSPAENKAFEKLKKAAEDFAEKRSDLEVDKSGSNRGEVSIAEDRLQQVDFIESLEKLEKNQAPRYTEQQLQTEDAQLNRLYRKLRSEKPEESSGGYISFRGIQTTQKAWLRYRDAWVEFAKLKYPSYPAGSIGAWFTKKRNHMLRSLLDEV